MREKYCTIKNATELNQLIFTVFQESQNLKLKCNFQQFFMSGTLLK